MTEIQRALRDIIVDANNTGEKLAKAPKLRHRDIAAAAEDEADDEEQQG